MASLLKHHWNPSATVRLYVAGLRNVLQYLLFRVMQLFWRNYNMFYATVMPQSQNKTGNEQRNTRRRRTALIMSIWTIHRRWACLAKLRHPLPPRFPQFLHSFSNCSAPLVFNPIVSDVNRQCTILPSLIGKQPSHCEIHGQFDSAPCSPCQQMRSLPSFYWKTSAMEPRKWILRTFADEIKLNTNDEPNGRGLKQALLTRLQNLLPKRYVARGSAIPPPQKSKAKGHRRVHLSPSDRVPDDVA